MKIVSVNFPLSMKQKEKKYKSFNHLFWFLIKLFQIPSKKVDGQHKRAENKPIEIQLYINFNVTMLFVIERKY